MITSQAAASPANEMLPRIDHQCLAIVDREQTAVAFMMAENRIRISCSPFRLMLLNGAMNCSGSLMKNCLLSNLKRAHKKRRESP